MFPRCANPVGFGLGIQGWRLPRGVRPTYGGLADRRYHEVAATSGALAQPVLERGGAA